MEMMLTLASLDYFSVPVSRISILVSNFILPLSLSLANISLSLLFRPLIAVDGRAHAHKYKHKHICRLRSPVKAHRTRWRRSLQSNVSLLI